VGSRVLRLGDLQRMPLSAFARRLTCGSSLFAASSLPSRQEDRAEARRSASTADRAYPAAMWLPTSRSNSAAAEAKLLGRLEAGQRLAQVSGTSPTSLLVLAAIPGPVPALCPGDRLLT